MPVETAQNTSERRLFDIETAVMRLRQLGAQSATVSFVRGIINRGEVPHLKIGKKFYVTDSALDQWIAHHERRK